MYAHLQSSRQAPCAWSSGRISRSVFSTAAERSTRPRHGSLFDLKTGKPKTLPAYVPVDTFPVIIDEEKIKLEVE